MAWQPRAGRVPAGPVEVPPSGCVSGAVQAQILAGVLAGIELGAWDQLPCGDLVAGVVLCVVWGVNVGRPRRGGWWGLAGWCGDRWLAVRGSLPGGVPDGCDHELQVPVV